MGNKKLKTAVKLIRNISGTSKKCTKMMLIGKRDIEEALTLTEYFAKYQGKLTESASTWPKLYRRKM